MGIIEEPKPTSETVPNENDPSLQVRTDMWSTMSTSQLTRQRELMLDKLSKLQSMMGGVANPTILNMYSALQMGMQDLNNIIDHKMSQRR
jgi:hypothetical protein